MNSLVSIITVNYNGLSYLPQFISSIKNQNYKDIELIVVDNNSTDGSREFLEKNHPEIKLLKQSENTGFAKGNNLAIEHANGEYIFLLNNDTELFPNAIQELIKAYKPNSVVTACQIPTREKQSTGRVGAGVDMFGYPYVEKDLTKTHVFYADGAAIFMKKSDFTEIGGFDEALFMFQEDIDFSWRARLYGYEIIPCWEAKLYHYFGGTATMEINESNTYVSSYFRRYLNERNIIRNILKNYSWIMYLLLIPTLMFFHGGEIIILSLLGKWKVVQCYLKAYWWNIIHLSDTLKMRSLVQKRRTVGDSEILKHMYKLYAKFSMFLRIGLPEFT